MMWEQTVKKDEAEIERLKKVKVNKNISVSVLNFDKLNLTRMSYSSVGGAQTHENH